MVKTDTISLNTKGFSEVLDITDKVARIVKHSGIHRTMIEEIAFCYNNSNLRLHAVLEERK